MRSTPDAMIVVKVVETGDWAECETPEDALCAANTMLREAWYAKRTAGYDPSAIFIVDGKAVRRMSLKALGRG